MSITKERLERLALQPIFQTIEFLTPNEIRQFAPAVYNNKRNFNSTSSKFEVIKLYEIIEGIQKIDSNWGVRIAVQENSKKGATSKVMVRMANPLLEVDGRTPEMILFNGADGTFRFKNDMGYINHICWNSMVTGKILHSITQRHMGDKAKNIVSTVLMNFEEGLKAMEVNIKKMQNFELTKQQKETLALQIIAFSRHQNKGLMQYMGIDAKMSRMGLKINLNDSKQKVRQRIDIINQMLTPQLTSLVNAQGTNSAFDVLNTLQRNILIGGDNIRYKSVKEVLCKESGELIEKVKIQSIRNTIADLDMSVRALDKYNKGGTAKRLLLPHAPTQIRGNHNVNNFLYNKVAELVPELV